MIHLDTSFVVDLLRERRRGKAGPATALLGRVADEPVEISVFVACELHLGIALAQRPEEERAHLLDVVNGLSVVYPDERLPPLYASVVGTLRRKGSEIATMDVLIGCLALIRGASLATGNARHFRRVSGLELLTY